MDEFNKKELAPGCIHGEVPQIHFIEDHYNRLSTLVLELNNVSSRLSERTAVMFGPVPPPSRSNKTDNPVTCASEALTAKLTELSIAINELRNSVELVEKFV